MYKFENAPPFYRPAGWLQRILPTIGRYGIVSRIFRLLKKPCDFPVHMWAADLQLHARMRMAEAEERLPASGVGLTSESALASALGEALERYCFVTVFPPEACTARWHNIKEKTFNLRELPFLIPKEQTTEDFFHSLECREIKWTEATEVSRGEETKFLVPSAIVSGCADGEGVAVTTNGLACGNSGEEAVLHALYEVIEREAVMIAWYHRYAGSLLDVRQILPKEILRMIEDMRHINVDFQLRDISSELGIPTFLGFVIHRRNGKPSAFACGAAAGIDIERTATRAFLEACLSWRGGNDIVKIRGLMPKPQKIPTPLNFSDHLYFYQHPWIMEAIDFLLPNGEISSAGQRQRFSSTVEELKYCIKLLSQKCFQVLKVDVTSTDVEELGVKVVRVIIPGLVPLFIGRYHAFYNLRLKKPPYIPEGQRLKDSELNPYPHPFP